jgi:hypothetical protein
LEPGVSREFCTLVTGGYLPQALVLRKSLLERRPDVRLRVGCLDETSRSLLDRLALPGIVTVPVTELERGDPELFEVREGRNQAEFCFTAKASLCLHVLKHEPELEGITYLDADLMFFDDPAAMFEGFGHSSIQIVPQRRPEGSATRTGSYDASVVTFRRDETGLGALAWWRERCIEWCYQRSEDGRWTDQRYLEDWPERFPGVRVVDHPGAGLAPWNIRRHAVAKGDDGVLVDGRPLVYYHYSTLTLYEGITTLRRLGLLSKTYRLTAGPVPVVWTVWHRFAPSDWEEELLWHPYLERIGESIAQLRELDSRFRPTAVQGRADVRRRLARTARDLGRRGLSRAADAIPLR